MKRELNNQEFIDIPRSNREYLGYIDKTTDHIYMLSEFIDNSIQSAKDWNYSNVQVKIILNKEQGRLIIADNAGGIEFKNRGIAIKNGKDENEQGNSLNMFGVGMKMASIWYGRRMTFYTKSPNDSFAYSLTLDVDELEEKGFKAELKKDIDIASASNYDFNYEHGTTVVIEKFHYNTIHSGRYDKKWFVPSKNKDETKILKSLSEQLACRFSRYLKKGFLTLSLSYIDQKGHEKMSDGKPAIITESTIPNLFISKMGKNDYETKNGLNIMKNPAYKKGMDKILAKYGNNLDDDIGFEGLTYRKIIEKFNNQEELVFDCKFNFKHETNDKKKNISVPVKFGYLKKMPQFSKFAGFAVFQDDRAIISGPNTTQTQNTWLTYDKALSNNSIIVTKRFAGEIDLNDKNVFRVDNNKMNFHGNVKEEFESQFAELFKSKLEDIFRIILDIIFAKEEQEESDKKSNAEISRFVQQINNFDLLEGSIVEEKNLNVNDDSGEREKSAIKLINKEKNISFSLTWYLREFENENKTIFKAETRPISDDETILVLLVNKNFVGFKPGTKEEDFSILINPILKLILHLLKDCSSSETRWEKFQDTVEFFMGDK